MSHPLALSSALRLPARTARAPGLCMTSFLTSGSSDTRQLHLSLRIN